MTRWTPAMKAQIRDLVEQKMTYREIAKRLGVTIGAISGQCYWMGIQSKSGIKFGTLESQMLSAKRRRTHNDIQRMKASVARIGGGQKPEPVKRPKIKRLKPGEIELRPDREYRYLGMSCQFIAGDPRKGASKCGGERLCGHAWCGKHATVVYAKSAGHGGAFVLEGAPHAKRGPKSSAMAMRSGRVSSQMGA